MRRRFLASVLFIVSVFLWLMIPVFSGSVLANEFPINTHFDGTGINGKFSSGTICVGGLIFLEKNKVCYRCPDCPCIDFKIFYVGVKGERLIVKTLFGQEEKEFELLLSANKEAYLNIPNIPSSKKTFLLKIINEENCIIVKNTEYKEDYPISWSAIRN